MKRKPLQAFGIEQRLQPPAVQRRLQAKCCLEQFIGGSSMSDSSWWIAFPTEAKAEEVRQKLLRHAKGGTCSNWTTRLSRRKTPGGRTGVKPADQYHYGGRGFRHLLGHADRPDLPDASGWRRDGRRVRRPRRSLDGPRHQRQMDEGNRGRHSARHGSLVRARAQGHGGQGAWSGFGGEGAARLCENPLDHAEEAALQAALAEAKAAIPATTLAQFHEQCQRTVQP